MNALCRTPGRTGVEVLCDTGRRRVAAEDGFFTAADVSHRRVRPRIRAKAMVAAAGGSQTTRGRLRRYRGEAADRFRIRGTPCAQARELRDLLDQGRRELGDPTRSHAVANDARAPMEARGLAARLDRFHDEGEDTWPKRYAIRGRRIARQPNRRAFASAHSVDELARG